MKSLETIVDRVDFEVYLSKKTIPPSIVIMAYNPKCGPRGPEGQSSEGPEQPTDEWLGVGRTALERAFLRIK